MARAESSTGMILGVGGIPSTVSQNRFPRTLREGVRSIKRITIAAVIYRQASGHYDGERRLLAVVRKRHRHTEVPV